MRMLDRAPLIVATSLVLLGGPAPLADAAAINKYFCGSSWDDASSNCIYRSPCPRASDSECFVKGQICFADTMCDSNTPGHGSSAPKNPMANLNLPDYGDIANTKFCQNQWNPDGDADDYCRTDLWCGDGTTSCPAGKICHFGDCHIRRFHSV